MIRAQMIIRTLISASVYLSGANIPLKSCHVSVKGSGISVYSIISSKNVHVNVETPDLRVSDPFHAGRHDVEVV